MSIDEQQLEAFRESLRADDYEMVVTAQQDRAEVTITAGPEACEECLVPKYLMAVMLAPMLGVAPDSIDLSYPADSSAS
ncbi:MAG: hypothetical protein ACRDO0_17785 [Nocardioidaceae bacterium]